MDAHSTGLAPVVPVVPVLAQFLDRHEASLAQAHDRARQLGEAFTPERAGTVS